MTDAAKCDHCTTVVCFTVHSRKCHVLKSDTALFLCQLLWSVVTVPDLDDVCAILVRLCHDRLPLW
jgi:hypothetical protein